MIEPADASLRAELAPSGTLRVGINTGNFLLVTPGAPDAPLRGVAPDLALELGRRVELPVALVRFETAGAMADAAARGAWDVAFLGAEPQRAGEIDFSPAYLEIPVTCLVPAGSPIASLADLDRDGVRIAVAEKSAYDLYLSRNLRHARLVRARGIDASYGLFVAERLEALGGLRPKLLDEVKKLPGARVLDGQLTAVQQSVGVPKGRDAAARYLRGFVEQIKASGLVAAAIARNGVEGVSVAPPTAQ